METQERIAKLAQAQKLLGEAQAYRNAIEQLWRGYISAPDEVSKALRGVMGTEEVMRNGIRQAFDDKAKDCEGEALVIVQELAGPEPLPMNHVTEGAPVDACCAEVA